MPSLTEIVKEKIDTNELAIADSDVLIGGVNAGDLAKGRMKDGTAAQPSISFVNDTDTGLFRKADNSIGVSTNGVERMTVSSSGRLGIGETNPASLLAVKVENNATAGIRCRSEWTGSTASPYQNNDNCLFETYNNVTSDSLNLSWSVSAPNGYNNIPSGVIDTGERFGVYGWAVSVNIPGYTHAGTLATQYGVYGRAGFQGGGANASPAGAVIQNSIGVRGQIRSDSPGATIVNARAGEFVAWGYESGTVETNYAVFAKAANGTEANWAFYGDLGNFFNREKSFFGTVNDAPFTESNAKASSRINNNSFEWGFPDAGYGCNLGATPTTGYPFIAFCAEAEAAGDNYRTRGRVGHVIQSSLVGELIFGILPSNNVTNQELVEAFKITTGAGVNFSNRIALAGAAPATSTSAGTVGQVAWDAEYFYVCVATDTWKRTALSTW
jgi:hypothetical protein